MNIQVLKENLAKTIQLAVKYASQKAQVPILSNVALEAGDQGIFVTATSLDAGIRLRMAGKVIESGGVVVPAKILSELTQSLPLGGVTLRSEESGDLMITAQRVKAKLQTMPIAEFPPFPELGPLNGELEIDDFVKAYEGIGFAVAVDEVRPVLAGVLWQFNAGTLVATDGYRLSHLTGLGAVDLGVKELTSLIIPGKALVQSLQVFQELKSGKVRVGFSEVNQQLVLSGEDSVVVLRVISGEFPKFEAILPSDSTTDILINREQFLSAVRSAVIFARDSANIVKLTIGQGNLEVSANALQVGENSVEVEYEPKLDGSGTIAFNGKYLLDFLTHVKSERVGFGMTDSLKPGLFYEDGVSGYRHVIMPVRVKGEGS